MMKIEITEGLPPGMVDLLDSWNKARISDDDVRRHLESPDPLLRARSLYLGVERGLIRTEDLRAKASSDDWPERLIATLHGANPQAAQDHVYWVSAFAG
jgi:hypothetical protein